MRLLTRRLSDTLRSAVAASSARQNLTTLPRTRGGLLGSLWSTTQLRHARFSGSDVRPGNVIERRGKLFEVINAHHTTQGRGGAIMQVELRDVDSGNKVNERLRTDESVEKIFVQEKLFTYAYTDDETGNIVLLDKSYDQLEVPKHLFGESLVYLQDEMQVTVRLYDEKPLSVSIPVRVTCTVVDAAEALKGRGPTPYKRAVLDNGLAVKVPVHIAPGEKVVISTKDNTYHGRSFNYSTFWDISYPRILALIVIDVWFLRA
ncbi:hypothetical protein ACS0TY_006486 [Phlomoides rotata]